MRKFFYTGLIFCICLTLFSFKETFRKFFTAQNPAAMTTGDDLHPLPKEVSFTAQKIKEPHSIPRDQNKPTHTQAQERSMELLSTVLKQDESPDLRRHHLYLLTQMGAGAVSALSAVAMSPVKVFKSQDPHSADSAVRNFELGLRITAIEALDDILVSQPEKTESVKKTMTAVLENQSEGSLKLLAQMSLSGIAAGRPGKIKRAIDSMIQEKGGL